MTARCNCQRVHYTIAKRARAKEQIVSNRMVNIVTGGSVSRRQKEKHGRKLDTLKRHLKEKGGN